MKTQAWTLITLQENIAFDITPKAQKRKKEIELHKNLVFGIHHQEKDKPQHMRIYLQTAEFYTACISENIKYSHKLIIKT